MGVIYKNSIPYGDDGGSPLPDGGTTGQALVKKTNADQDVEWKTVGGGDYTAGNGIDITGNEISVDDTVVATKGDLADKQDTLVSGTNIKTVNNQSLLGSGNIDIQGGIDLEIGAEKWYGTYKEDGVTYQVYSKVLKIAALPAAAGITNYPHGITGIKQILCAYGFGTNGFVLNAPRQNAQDNIAIYQVQKASGGSVAIEVGKDRSSMGAYVCLVYAKNN